MKKIMIIINILIILFSFKAKKEEIIWEEIITDEVIEDIISNLDTENKIFLNVVSPNKMIIPTSFENHEIYWEYDSAYLNLTNDTFIPKKNGTTFITANILGKKHFFVAIIKNNKFNKTSQYNLDFNYHFISNNKKIGKQMTPTKIVFHNTANTASALNEVKWLSNITNTSSTSFHYAVDDLGIYQAISTNNVAFHAGNYQTNLNSIGIEIAKSMIEDDMIKDKAISNTILLITLLMNNYNISINNVITHKDASGKHCPHDVLDRYKLQHFYDGIINLI